MSSPAETTVTVTSAVLRVDPEAGLATCEVAHGHVEVPETGRSIVAVFFSPVAEFLLRYGQDAGFHPILVEPGPVQAEAARAAGWDVADHLHAGTGWDADVVLTDHHRPELGP